MQRDVTGGRGQVPVVVAASVTLTSLVALVTRRLRQLLRFRLQQLVQRFFYVSAHQFLDLPLDYFQGAAVEFPIRQSASSLMAGSGT